MTYFASSPELKDLVVKGRLHAQPFRNVSPGRGFLHSGHRRSQSSLGALEVFKDDTPLCVVRSHRMVKGRQRERGQPRICFSCFDVWSLIFVKRTSMFDLFAKNTLQVPFLRFDYVSTQWPMKIHLFLWLLAGVNIKQAYMVNPHYLVSWVLPQISFTVLCFWFRKQVWL